MKATGIVRRIDDLGRVVIPKEIRRTMRIREGDPLEIFTDAEGQVIFKKYSPMGEFTEFTAQYADVLNKSTGMPIIITDRDHVISSAGIVKREVYERRISAGLESLMESRSSFIAATGNKDSLLPIENSDIKASVAFPIIGNGDVTGCVVLLFNQHGDMPSQAEIKLAQVASEFLAKQTED